MDKVIVGEKKENGEVDPYNLKFVYKTGMENEVAAKQPFSFGNSYSQTVDEYGKLCSDGEDDTYRGCSPVATSRILII